MLNEYCFLTVNCFPKLILMIFGVNSFVMFRKKGRTSRKETVMNKIQQSCDWLVFDIDLVNNTFMVQMFGTYRKVVIQKRWHRNPMPP